MSIFSFDEWGAYKAAHDYRAKGIQWQAKVVGLVTEGPLRGMWEVRVW